MAEMSQVRSKNSDMRTPPPELPDHATELPAGPAVLPLLPPLPGQPFPGSPFPRQPGRWRPLPDAIAVYRIPLPESAPPYDDHQGDGEPLAGVSPRARAAGGTGRSAVTTTGAGQWAHQFAQALAETLAGARSAQQMTPWTTQQARRRIRQLGPMLKAEQRPRVRRVLTSAPATDVVEMAVIVGIGPRIRAVAVRLERTGPERGPSGCERQWLCTAIETA